MTKGKTVHLHITYCLLPFQILSEDNTGLINGSYVSDQRLLAQLHRKDNEHQYESILTTNETLYTFITHICMLHMCVCNINIYIHMHIYE